MRFEEVYTGPEGRFISIEELKRIVDEAHAKAPPGTLVLFRGDNFVPEEIRASIVATHITLDGYLERMTDDEMETRNAEERAREVKSAKPFFKLDTPVILLINHVPTEKELAV